jgi:hypothetical protein
MPMHECLLAGRSFLYRQHRWLYVSGLRRDHPRIAAEIVKKNAHGLYLRVNGKNSK